MLTIIIQWCKNYGLHLFLKRKTGLCYLESFVNKWCHLVYKLFVNNTTKQQENKMSTNYSQKEEYFLLFWKHFTQMKTNNVHINVWFHEYGLTTFVFIKDLLISLLFFTLSASYKRLISTKKAKNLVSFNK